ncbi:MAG: 3-phosphoshikimate 1-carboxyvinyltransferase [Bacteroidales bacterium]|nr:3-phosphoshikimate 1-carboxyvinyltransferase [Bacteroidales bacterium]
MSLVVRRNLVDFQANIHLPLSKSISNRALMIQAYSKPVAIDCGALSDADDTRLLQKNLKLIRKSHNSHIQTVVDCGNAGTVFRFLAGFLASTEGCWLLTGSERMKQRPVSDLVVSLRHLGAEIEYAEKQDFPPLRINGKKLPGGKTRVSMEKSSQFASSLVMMAPTLEKGLELQLEGALSSLPYLDMTLAMMRQSGAIAVRNHDLVTVYPQAYGKAQLKAEADWSAAAFWYELVALSHGGNVLLAGLDVNSLQGDREMIKMFEKLGISSRQEAEGVRIRRIGKVEPNLKFDLHHFPDMLPSLAACCAGLGVEASFCGLANLRHKESDRTLALQQEFSRFGTQFLHESNDSYRLLSNPSTAQFQEQTPVFETYNDHRIAMAFAPLAMVFQQVEIINPAVVEKSYPRFWEEMATSGAVHLKFKNENN